MAGTAAVRFVRLCDADAHTAAETGVYSVPLHGASLRIERPVLSRRELREGEDPELTFEGAVREVMRVQLLNSIHPMSDLTFNPTATPGSADWRLQVFVNSAARRFSHRVSRTTCGKTGRRRLRTRPSPPHLPKMIPTSVCLETSVLAVLAARRRLAANHRRRESLPGALLEPSQSRESRIRPRCEIQAFVIACELPEVSSMLSIKTST